MTHYRGYVGNFFQVAFLERLGLATEIEASKRNKNWENFLMRLQSYPLSANVTLGNVSGRRRNLFILGHSKIDFLRYIYFGYFRRERCLLIEEGASLSGWRGDNGIPRLSYFFRWLQIFTVRQLKCGSVYELTDMITSLSKASQYQMSAAPSAPTMKVVIGQPLVEDGYISAEDYLLPLSELGDRTVIYLLHPRETKEKLSKIVESEKLDFVILDTEIAEAFVIKNAGMISSIYGHSSTSLLVFVKLNLDVRPLWGDSINRKSARLKAIYESIFNV